MGRNSRKTREDYKWKYLVLFAANLTQVYFLIFKIDSQVASYFGFDIPAALKDQIALQFSSELTPTEFEFYYNGFYSGYAIPNIILPLINGYYIEKVIYSTLSDPSLGEERCF